MEETHLAGRCPRCGRALATDAPEGLCPSCLLAVATESLTYGSTDDAPTVLSAQGSAAAHPDHAARLTEGQRFGPYLIGRLLGRGGMGEVYEAEHVETGRRLAIKVLRGRFHDGDDRARFLREGQLAASVSHPHTVYIFGSEEVGGMPVISMELLPGGTLKDLVAARGPLPVGQAVTAVLEIIGGLDAAHAAGILHRDIKPSNCFTDVDGTVKVGDFGLSISTLARDVHAGAAASGFEGTPQYAAPEQLRGQPLDVRADIYAVGATLYYLLTGEPPFDARDLRELVTRVTTEPPPSPRLKRPDVPSPLAAIVLHCLAKDPQARPASYAALANALQPFSAAAAAPARIGLRLIAGLVDAIIIGLPFSIVGPMFMPVVRTQSYSVNPLSALTLAVGILYYFTLEGRWGASLGKRLFGLRVTSVTGLLTWRQVAARVAMFYLPAMPISLAILVFGPVRLVDYMNRHPALAIVSAVSPILLTAALYLTIRRANGWAALHDLVSGTRVVMRSAAIEAPRIVLPIAVLRSAPTGIRCGPFDVVDDLGEVEGGHLFSGFDPRLRRPVWIRAVPSGTPPVTTARRDAGRAGRLRWLSGRRSADENWDAFEAPEGDAFLATPHSAAWPAAKRWLLDVATELAASDCDGTRPRLALDHIWIRAAGGAVVLDFVPTKPKAKAERLQELESPVALLGAMARHALPVTAEAGDATRTAPPAMPVSAVKLLRRWMRGDAQPIDEARQALADVVALPDEPPRLRRGLPILFGALPIVGLLFTSFAIMPALRAALTPDLLEVYQFLGTLQAAETGRATLSPQKRDAIELYLAGRHRSHLTDEAMWNNLVMQSNLIALKPIAERIVAAHPTVPDDELRLASAWVADDVAKIGRTFKESVEPRLLANSLIVVVGLAGISALFVLACMVIAAMVSPAGVVTRLAGHVLASRAGRPIGRARALARVLIAWSPLVVWLVWLLASGGINLVFGVPVRVGLWLGLALAIMAAGAVLTVATGRGLQDRLTGTWTLTR